MPKSNPSAFTFCCCFCSKDDDDDDDDDEAPLPLAAPTPATVALVVTEDGAILPPSALAGKCGKTVTFSTLGGASVRCAAAVVELLLLVGVAAVAANEGEEGSLFPIVLTTGKCGKTCTFSTFGGASVRIAPPFEETLFPSFVEDELSSFFFLVVFFAVVVVFLFFVIVSFFVAFAYARLLALPAATGDALVVFVVPKIPSFAKATDDETASRQSDATRRRPRSSATAAHVLLLLAWTTRMTTTPTVVVVVVVVVFFFRRGFFFLSLSLSRLMMMMQKKHFKSFVERK